VASPYSGLWDPQFLSTYYFARSEGSIDAGQHNRP